MIAARLLAHAPNGAPLGEMPYPLTVDPMVTHNDVGSLAFTYSNLAAGGAHLATALQSGLEVALELSTGEKDALGRDIWVEPKGCRFVRLEDDADPSDPTKRVSLTLPSFGWLLSKCVVGAAGAVDGRRVFVAPTVGDILLALLDENAARDGYATSIAPTFTEMTDSAGTAWPVLPDQSFEVGADYLTVLDGLTAAGACDWTTQARGLYVYLPDAAALSPDLSGTGGVVLSLGTDVAGAPTKRSIANMSGRVLVLAEAGGVTMAEEPTAVTGWGVPESTLRIGQVAGESAAIAVGQAELERVGRPQGQFTRELILLGTSKVPLLDYWPGCWILAPGAAGAGEKLRVLQSTLAFQGKAASGSLTLNDVMLESDERRARTLASLAGGTISPGGPAAPIAVDPEASRVPSTPTGLDATAALYFDAGVPRGIVTATWNPVTTATDSGALAIAGYELQYRIGAGAWQNISTPEVSAEITGLTPGDVVTVRVRTVGARTTLPSAWSATDSATVSGDTTPPSVPSVPTLISRLGVVTVVWDGLTNVGTPMEDDFHHVDVAMADSPTPTTVVGTMTRAGMLPITDQTIGQNRQVRLRSVDTSGNMSAWSVVTEPVEVHGVTGPDLEANSVTANAILAGSLTGDLFAALMVISSMYTTSESGTGQRVEWDINGIRLFNSLDELRVNLPTDPSLEAYFRGEVQADGLTVTGGASFFSTQNEFAPDSIISLAAAVAAPVAPPNVSTFWPSVQLQKVSVSDVLGTFGLDISQVQSACWNHTVNQFHLVQKVPAGGARIWYYTINGLYSTHWDLPDAWDVSSLGVGLDGEFRILYKFSSRWWVYDYSRPVGSRDREYIPMNTAKRPFLTMEEGTNNIYITEVDTDNALKTRRVTTDTNPVTAAATTTMTGVTPAPGNIAAVYRGTADFGVTKTVVSHRNTFSYRHFSTAGVYQPEWGFNPPASKVGGFWNPNVSRFYTVGADGKLHSHTGPMWTSSALDTWHLGQTFRDSNATGGTHETTVGAFRTFNPQKRATSRVALATVPYAGGTDDPNAWRLYGKTGTAPDAIGTGTTLQVSGAYTVHQTDISSLLTTGGSAPPATSNFPAANPARLQSAARLPSDATKPIIDLRGDGFARLGPLEVSNTGVLTDTRDVLWTTTGMTFDANWESFAATPGNNYVEFCRIGGVVHMRGLVRTLIASSGASATTLTMLTLPVGFRPSRTLVLAGMSTVAVTSGPASTGTAHTHSERVGPVVRVNVNTDGTVSMVRELGHVMSVGTWVSLAEVSFPTL